MKIKDIKVIQNSIASILRRIRLQHRHIPLLRRAPTEAMTTMSLYSMRKMMAVIVPGMQLTRVRFFGQFVSVRRCLTRAVFLLRHRLPNAGKGRPASEQGGSYR
jgi:hypothetical protein